MSELFAERGPILDPPEATREPSSESIGDGRREEGIHLIESSPLHFWRHGFVEYSQRVQFYRWRLAGIRPQVKLDDLFRRTRHDGLVLIVNDHHCVDWLDVGKTRGRRPLFQDGEVGRLYFAGAHYVLRIGGTPLAERNATGPGPLSPCPGVPVPLP